MDVLLDPCHDLRQGGVDEMHKQMSALGYAMQFGQTKIVDKVGAALLFGNGAAGIGNPDVCGVCSSVDEIRLPDLHRKACLVCNSVLLQYEAPPFHLHVAAVCAAI